MREPLKATEVVVFLPLTQGKVAVIDFDDFEKVGRVKWHAVKIGRRFYAVRWQDGKKVKLHRVLTDCPSDKQVDHIDGDGLNNRRSNLRVCSHAQNQRAFKRKKIGATSKFRGVTFFKRDAKWQAKIKKNGKHFHLGLYESEEDAARAYDKAARKLFGKFASTNYVTTK